MIRKILPFKRDIIISSNYKKNAAALSALIHVYSQRDFLHKRVIRFYPFIPKKVIFFTFPLHLPCLIFFDLYADESFICHGKGDLEALMPQCFQCLAVFAVLSLEEPNLGALFMRGYKLIRFHFMSEVHFQFMDLGILFAQDTF